MHTPVSGLPALLLPGACLMIAALAPAPARAQTPEQTPPPSAPGAPNPPGTEAPEDEQEPPRPRPRFRFGPEAGVYLPTNSKARERFGKTWFNLGVGIGSIPERSSQGRLGVDLRIITHRSGDNRVLLIPLGVSYQRALTQTATSFRPYAGASLNVYLADLRVPSEDIHSGVRAAGGGSVFVGATLRTDGFVEARYHAVSRVRGFDLSGLNLTAGYRF